MNSIYTLSLVSDSFLDVLTHFRPVEIIDCLQMHFHHTRMANVQALQYLLSCFSIGNHNPIVHEQEFIELG